MEWTSHLFIQVCTNFMLSNIKKFTTLLQWPEMQFSHLPLKHYWVRHRWLLNGWRQTWGNELSFPFPYYLSLSLHFLPVFAEGELCYRYRNTRTRKKMVKNTRVSGSVEIRFRWDLWKALLKLGEILFSDKSCEWVVLKVDIALLVEVI